MAIKSILAHVGEGTRHQVNLALAAELARTHEAHLAALYTFAPWEIPAYVAAYVPPEVTERAEREAKEQADAVRNEFEKLCRKQGVSGEWRAVKGDPVGATAEHARYADLTVVGQPDPDATLPAGLATLPHDVVLGSGRPLLVVPYAGKFAQVGQRVLIAWNGSREAARAVHDALPLMKGAKSVRITTVNPGDSEHLPGAEVATYLARHGLKAEANAAVADDIEVADVLLDIAAEFGADLLVMGAWGHSRLREVILGGATHNLLRQMTVPVLMSN